MKIELEKIGDETPEDDKPLFTRAGAKAIFNEIRSFDMGWKNENGKPCLGIKEDDPEPFICMLQGKPTAAKMTWTATTPNDKKIPYIKPLYELLRLCGYKHEDIANMVYKYFGKEVDENTMRNWKSDYKRKNDKGKSMKYTSLQKIINTHKQD